MRQHQRPHANEWPGRIHIIGGQLRGSRLAVAAVPGLRPTPQRLRQTLFDWLAPVIPGARVLDAFAGTGALGIEALSRGAASVSFFEYDDRCADALAANLARLRQDHAEVTRVDTVSALRSPPPARFDIAFVDPPFAAGLWSPACAALEANAWLAAGAWVYVEAGVDAHWDAPAAWRVHRQAVAGAVRGTLLRRGESQEL